MRSLVEPSSVAKGTLPRGSESSPPRRLGARVAIVAPETPIGAGALTLLLVGLGDWRLAFARAPPARGRERDGAMSARRRREAHAIYLIPGFFGFTNLGRFRYFTHVDRFLRERCAERGIDARVHVVPTHPTASLPKRAALVVETLARTTARARRDRPPDRPLDGRRRRAAGGGARSGAADEAGRRALGRTRAQRDRRELAPARHAAGRLPHHAARPAHAGAALPHHLLRAALRPPAALGAARDRSVLPARRDAGARAR